MSERDHARELDDKMIDDILKPSNEATDGIGAELFARYSTMSQREMVERAIFLEGYIVSLTGRICTFAAQPERVRIRVPAVSRQMTA